MMTAPDMNNQQGEQGGMGQRDQDQRQGDMQHGGKGGSSSTYGNPDGQRQEGGADRQPGGASQGDQGASRNQNEQDPARMDEEYDESGAIEGQDGSRY